MRKFEHPTYVDLASWLFCAFLSRSLIVAWTSFPMLRWSAAAFCIWMIPLLTYWLYPYAKEARHANPILLGLGVLLSLLGLLGELNILKHAGLAVATVGLMPWSGKQLLWLATALAWLPAAAYLLRFFPFDLIIALRIFIVMLGAATSVWALFYDHVLVGKGYDKEAI